VRVVPAVLAALLVAAPLARVARAQGAPTPEPAEDAATTDATPGPVSVVATASKDEVTVGETFTIELKAMGPPGTTYRFASGASEEEIELRTPEPGEAAGEDGPVPEPGTHRYEAAVFVLGEVEIPPIPVRFRLSDGTEGEAASEPILLKVGSLLPRDADEQKLADIRGPQSVGIGRAFWVAIVAALLLVAGLVAWLVRRRKKTVAPEAPSVPETPPDVEALAALRALASAGLLEARAFREFYIRLTTIAKRYLERRLDAPVLEMTTAETTAFLREHAHGGELLPVVRDLAQAADQIKFARGQGLAEAAERHLAAVRALVPSLEARLRPVVPEGSEEGKAA
jgi:hypothetical protein